MPGSRTRWTFLAAFGAGLAAALAPSHAAHHPVTMTSLSYATTDSLVAQGLQAPNFSDGDAAQPAPAACLGFDHAPTPAACVEALAAPRPEVDVADIDPWNPFCEVIDPWNPSRGAYLVT